MAVSPTTRRNWVMHSAHRTIGILGGPMSARSCDFTEHGQNRGKAPRPLRLAVVARASDADLRAVAALLERAGDGHRDFECVHADFDRDLAADSRLGHQTDPDCLVMLVGGTHVLEPDALRARAIVAESGPLELGGGRLEIEIATSDQWHPILDGFGPFSADCCFPPPRELPTDAACLLTCRTANGPRPAAWTRCRHGREFHAIFGLSNTGRPWESPNVIHLLRNAIDWVSPPSETTFGR